MNFTMSVADLIADEKTLRLIAAIQTLTQDQIDACAWVMGGSGAGWTKEKILESFTTFNS